MAKNNELMDSIINAFEEEQRRLYPDMANIPANNLNFINLKAPFHNFTCPRAVVLDQTARWGLIVVDVQNDFLTGSMALAINSNESTNVVPAINRLLEDVRFDIVLFSQDWHPPDHCSFVCSDTRPIDGLKVLKWPEHCVENTWGAEFPPRLNTKPHDTQTYFVKKGSLRGREAFSVFDGNIMLDEEKNIIKKQSVKDLLLKENLHALFVCGIATEHCVLETCISAKQMLPDTRIFVIHDAVRGGKPFDSKIFLEKGIEVTSIYRIIYETLNSGEKMTKSNKNKKKVIPLKLEENKY